MTVAAPEPHTHHDPVSVRSTRLMLVVIAALTAGVLAGQTLQYLRDLHLQHSLDQQRSIACRAVDAEDQLATELTPLLTPIHRILGLPTTSDVPRPLTLPPDCRVLNTVGG